MLRQEIEQAYGIRIEKWQAVKDVVRLCTSTGSRLCLKGFAGPVADVQFIVHVTNYLRHVGFRRTPRIYQTRTGLRWITHNAKCYIVTDWVVGRSPDFTNRSELRAGVETLATFHRFAEGISVTDVPESRKRVLGLHAHIDSFKETLQACQRLTKSGVNLGQCIALCDQAEQCLQMGDVQTAIAREYRKRAFVHGDYNYPNLVRDQDGTTHLIDFDNTSLHVRMMDLAHILHRNVAWEGTQTLRLIEQYNHVRSLSTNDTKLLYVLLVLPYPIVRFLRQYPHEPQQVAHVLPSKHQISQYLRTLRTFL